MRKLSSLLTLFLICSILAAPLRAQQSGSPISALKEQIARLEAIDLDPATPNEIRELNRRFLAERKIELAALIGKRIASLRAYQASVGSALKPNENQLITDSLRELELDLQSLRTGVERAAAPPSSRPQSRAASEAGRSTYLTAGYDNKSAASRRDGVAVASLTDVPVSATVNNNVAPSISFAPFSPKPTKTPQQQQQQQQWPASYDKEADVKIDVASEQAVGNKVRGPATVLLTNVNILRYDVRIGQDVSFPAAPDLKLPFIPPVPAKTAGGAAGASLDQGFFSSRLSGLIDDLGTIENGVVRNVQTPLEKVNDAKASVESLVSASDSMLATAGPNSQAGAQAIVDQLRTSVIPKVKDALSQPYPAGEIENAIAALNSLENELASLPSQKDPSNQETWDKWYTGNNKILYDNTIGRVRDLRTALRAMNRNDFRELQSKLNSWLNIMTSVQAAGADGFTRYVDVGCGFAFDTGKETKIKITKRDRLAEPTVTPTTEEIVTVVCSSPLSVSGGFGFSFVDEREFVFVASTKSVTTNGQTTQQAISRFGLKNSSNFRTLPVLLLNTRLWEPNDLFAIHASTGAIVDVKTGEGGTDLEFVVGPSLSFWRSLFITPGLHIGRVPRLAGGFALDQEVPTGIDKPPIEKAWKPGFITTFTYKIK